MSQIQARLLRGFRDYMPAAMLSRQKMLHAVEEVFLSYGFAPLQTPALEYSEILIGKSGDEGDKLLYRFDDNGGRDIALRYDLTVPLARVVAQNPDLALPFKRYQIAPVWRAEKPARGRFREFMQCDADIIGADGQAADVEILALGDAIMKSLGVEDFKIRINHRGVFDGLAALLGIQEESQKALVVRTLDKLEKIGKAKVLNILATDGGLDEPGIEVVTRYIDLPTGDTHAARAFFRGQAEGTHAVESLSGILALAQNTGCAQSLEVDFSIARGLDYYTGLIYETSLNALPEFGSVMSGGRYDGLMEIFGAKAHPAIGISLGVARLHAALMELGELGKASTATQVMVVVFGQEGYASAVALADRLRKGGIRTETYLDPEARIGKQFRYADRKGIPFVAVQGPDELAENAVRMKDLSKGDESLCPVDELSSWIQGRTQD